MKMLHRLLIHISRSVCVTFDYFYLDYCEEVHFGERNVP